MSGWCREKESNPRRPGVQPGALPAELSRQKSKNGVACGNRTRVPGMKPRCPGPLDERDTNQTNPLWLCPNASIPSDVVSRCTRLRGKPRTSRAAHTFAAAPECKGTPTVNQKAKQKGPEPDRFPGLCGGRAWRLGGLSACLSRMHGVFVQVNRPKGGGANRIKVGNTAQRTHRHRRRLGKRTHERGRSLGGAMAVGGGGANGFHGGPLQRATSALSSEGLNCKDYLRGRQPFPPTFSRPRSGSRRGAGQGPGEALEKFSKSSSIQAPKGQIHLRLIGDTCTHWVSLGHTPSECAEKARQNSLRERWGFLGRVSRAWHRVGRPW